MGLILRVLLTFILVISFALETNAEWQGPTEVTSGSWGSDVMQFGLDRGDSWDTFPLIEVVTPDNKIVIADMVNKKQIVIGMDGSFIKEVKWTIKRKSGGRTYYEVPEYSFGYVVGYSTDGNIYTVSGGKYFLKSPTGQLLETYKERPLWIGVVKGRSLGGKRYRTTIKYPDMTYTLSKGPYRKYIRICQENLYAVSGKSAEIFNTSGEAIDKIIMPKNQINEISPGGRGMEAVSEIIEQYGEPVIAPNGDVYTWKRTKDTYSIIKWIWIESRDAPVNLKASASDGKIALAWETPKQDANSVKAYEIYRSSDVCGPFSKIKKVKKGVLHYTDKKVKEGETYYYQVCAERGSGYSGYSNKAVGSIKD